MLVLLISTGFLSLYYVFHINVLCQSAFPNTLKLQLLLILSSFCPLSQVHYFPEAFHYLTIHTYIHTHTHTHTLFIVVTKCTFVCPTYSEAK